MTDRSLWRYDLPGVLLTCGVLALGAWSGLVHAPRTVRQYTEAKANLAKTRSALRAADAALHRQRAEVAALEEDIARRGALPARSPVEADLQTIAHLARNNGLELVRVTPLASATYPGITKLEYSVEGRSTFAALLGFLRDFERASFWADITQLQMADAAPGPTEDGAVRTARFVVSLFAAHDGAETPATAK